MDIDDKTEKKIVDSDNEWAGQQPFDDGGTRYSQGLEFQYIHTSQAFRIDDTQDAKTDDIATYATVQIPVIPQAFADERDGNESADADGGEAGAIQTERKVSSVSRAALLLTVASFAARFLGLFRTSLFSHLGTSTYTDAYNLAFNLPDLIYNIVAGGALLSAFIPIFHLYMVGKREEKTAWHVASSALNVSTAFLMVLAGIGMIFTPQIVHLYYFNTPAPELDVVASLMRIMFLQSVIMGAGVIISSVLNARGNFFLPALGSVLYPVGMMIGLIPSFIIGQTSDAARLTTMVYASWGVVLGAALMVVVQIPGLRTVGMRYSISFDWRHPGFRQMVRQMIPRMINALMVTMSQYSDFVLIGWLVVFVGSAGLVTQYRYAFTVVTIPLGVITPLATASFPRMAEYVAEERFNDLRHLILESLQSVLFIALPASIGLVLLSFPIVQVLFEHGSFTLSEAQSTSIPLICYALGLPGLALVEILTRPFYAMRQSKTPVYISLMQLGLKITMSIALLTPAVWLVQIGLGKIIPTSLDPLMLSGAWGMGGLAIGTTVSSLLEALALLWLLHRQLGGLHLRELTVFTKRVLIAVLALAIVIITSETILNMLLKTPDYGANSSIGITGIFIVAVKLIIVIGLASFVYLRLARWLHLLGGEQLRSVNRLLVRLHLAWI